MSEKGVLTIRPSQQRILVDQQRREFEADTVAFVRETLAEHTDNLADEEVTTAVASAIERAISYGLASELDLVRYVNFVFLLGADFEDSEEWGWIGATLTDESLHPSDRMNAIFERLEAAAEKQREPDDD